MNDYLESFVKDRAMTVANSVPGAKVRKQVIESGVGEYSSGTAAIDRKEQRLYISESFIKMLSERWEDYMDARKALMSVLIHEGIHSGHTHYWPKANSITAHWLFNHLEDIRMNSIGAVRVHYFEDGIQKAYKTLHDKDERRRQVELNDPSASTAQIVKTFIETGGKHATNPDAYKIWVDEANRITNPEARELALYLAEKFEAIRKLRPRNIHSVYSSRKASAEWALIAEEVKEKLEPVFKFKEEEEKFKQLQERLRSDLEQILKKIAEEVEKQEKSQESAGAGPQKGEQGQDGAQGGQSGQEKGEQGQDGAQGGQSGQEKGEHGQGGTRGGRSGQEKGEQGKDGAREGQTGQEDEHLNQAIRDFLDSLTQEKRQEIEDMLKGIDGIKGGMPVRDAEEKTAKELEEIKKENEQKEKEEEQQKSAEEIHRQINAKNGPSTNVGGMPGGAGRGELRRPDKPIRNNPYKGGDGMSKAAIARAQSLAELTRAAKVALSRSLMPLSSNARKYKPERDHSGDFDPLAAINRMANPRSGEPMFWEQNPLSAAPNPKKPIYSRILLAVDGSGSMDSFRERTKETLHVLHTVLGKEGIPVVSAIDYDHEVCVIGGGGVMPNDINAALSRIEELDFISSNSNMGPDAVAHLYHAHRTHPLRKSQITDARIIVLTDCIAGTGNIRSVRDTIQQAGLPAAVLSVGPKDENEKAEKILNEGLPQKKKTRIIGIDGRTYTEALFELFAWMQNPEAKVSLGPSLERGMSQEMKTLIAKDKKHVR